MKKTIALLASASLAVATLALVSSRRTPTPGAALRQTPVSGRAVDTLDAIHRPSTRAPHQNQPSSEPKAAPGPQVVEYRFVATRRTRVANADTTARAFEERLAGILRLTSVDETTLHATVSEAETAASSDAALPEPLRRARAAGLAQGAWLVADPSRATLDVRCPARGDGPARDWLAALVTAAPFELDSSSSAAFTQTAATAFFSRETRFERRHTERGFELTRRVLRWVPQGSAAIDSSEVLASSGTAEYDAGEQLTKATAADRVAFETGDGTRLVIELELSLELIAAAESTREGREDRATRLLESLDELSRSGDLMGRAAEDVTEELVATLVTNADTLDALAAWVAEDPFDPRVGKAVLAAVARVGTAGARRLLAEVLESSAADDPRVAAARVALFELELDAPASVAISAAARCDSPLSRTLTRGLILATDDVMVDEKRALESLLEHENDALAESQLLGWIEAVGRWERAAGGAVDRYLDDPSPLVRGAAVRSLRFRDDAQEQVQARWPHEEDARVRGAMIDVLAGLDGARGLELLADHAASDASEDVRERAAFFLGDE